MYLSFGFGANYRLLTLDATFRRLEIESVTQAYRRARCCRVFLLDNEGTLAPDLRQRRVQGAQGSDDAFELNNAGAPPNEAVLDCLREILKDPRNIVVIISGRPKQHMEQWFASVPNICLAAEHGFCYKIPTLLGEEWYTMATSQIDFTWKTIALEMMTQYRKRTQVAAGELFLAGNGVLLVGLTMDNGVVVSFVDEILF